MLVREPRVLPPASDAPAAARQIAEAILAGPTTDGLVAPFPTEVALGAVNVGTDGVVFIDLVSETLLRLPPRGSRVELLTLYSLVNSIVDNVDGAERVVLLWNGEQLRTLAGHIDTSQPIMPEPSLVEMDD